MGYYLPPSHPPYMAVSEIYSGLPAIGRMMHNALSTGPGKVVLGVSFAGSGPTPVSLSICPAISYVDLSVPIKQYNPPLTDTMGYTELGTNIPVGWAGLNVYAQAADRYGSCVLTNPEKRHVFDGAVCQCPY